MSVATRFEHAAKTIGSLKDDFIELRTRLEPHAAEQDGIKRRVRDLGEAQEKLAADIDALQQTPQGSLAARVQAFADDKKKLEDGVGEPRNAIVQADDAAQGRRRRVCQFRSGARSGFDVWRRRCRWPSCRAFAIRQSDASTARRDRTHDGDFGQLQAKLCDLQSRLVPLESRDAGVVDLIAQVAEIRDRLVAKIGSIEADENGDLATPVNAFIETKEELERRVATVTEHFSQLATIRNDISGLFDKFRTRRIVLELIRALCSAPLHDFAAWHVPDCAAFRLRRTGAGASFPAQYQTTGRRRDEHRPYGEDLHEAGVQRRGYRLRRIPGAIPARLYAQNAVSIKTDDIGGVVTGPHGPEAGVWVIAETHDLPTRYAKIVVTDDQGRYVVPDLPKAKYQVWVRGYGLVDSAKVDAAPGQHVNLTAVAAPDDAAAAQYYPAIYWFAMLKIPDKDQFGGKSDIPENVTQVDWLTAIKNQACVGCHQLGQLRRGPSRRRSERSRAAKTPGCGASSRVRRRRLWSTRSPANSAACRSNISATGPTASPRANCRSPSRRGRKASSAIS